MMGAYVEAGAMGACVEAGAMGACVEAGAMYRAPTTDANRGGRGGCLCGV